MQLKMLLPLFKWFVLFSPIIRSRIQRCTVQLTSKLTPACAEHACVLRVTKLKLANASQVVHCTRASYNSCIARDPYLRNVLHVRRSTQVILRVLQASESLCAARELTAVLLAEKNQGSYI